MTDWQEMATAPKDGTEVIAWVPSNYLGTGGIELVHVFDGRWVDSAHDECEPSHWMPLPDPPKVSA